MEYTNEFLARAYGAYIGSNIIMPKSGRIAKLQGVDFDGATTHLNDGEDNRNFEYFPFKLILTPLSEISDEDAIEVAKMLDPWLVENMVYEVKRESFDLRVRGRHDNSRMVQIIWFNSAIFSSDNHNINNGVIDFLRSKFYDMGYGEIPSLIEAGIAIDKTKIVQP